jgi:two-component system, OmpR family, phosphate regulon sensor histidine kinase PhoR
VRDTAAPMIAKAGLVLTVDLHGDLRLTGDREELERALLNLVSNAAKFTAPGGRIEIAVRDDADDLVVAVGDTGPGIPPEEQRHLFTRFFRSSRAKALQIGGTGLGLYIVKQIVDLHGGEVCVTSTPAGSTFTMRVPRSGPPLDPFASARPD